MEIVFGVVSGVLAAAIIAAGTWLYKLYKRVNKHMAELKKLKAELKKHETEHETGPTRADLTAELKKLIEAELKNHKTEHNETTKTLEAHDKRLKELETFRINLKRS